MLRSASYGQGPYVSLWDWWVESRTLHYTPKHGSWLDLAESELGVLSSQCRDRRIPDKQTLIDEIAAVKPGYQVLDSIH